MTESRCFLNLNLVTFEGLNVDGRRLQFPVPLVFQVFEVALHYLVPSFCPLPRLACVRDDEVAVIFHTIASASPVLCRLESLPAAIEEADHVGTGSCAQQSDSLLYVIVFLCLRIQHSLHFALLADSMASKVHEDDRVSLILQVVLSVHGLYLRESVFDFLV